MPSRLFGPNGCLISPVSCLVFSLLLPAALVPAAAALGNMASTAAFAASRSHDRRTLFRLRAAVARRPVILRDAAAVRALRLDILRDAVARPANLGSHSHLRSLLLPVSNLRLNFALECLRFAPPMILWPRSALTLDSRPCLRFWCHTRRPIPSPLPRYPPAMFHLRLFPLLYCAAASPFVPTLFRLPVRHFLLFRGRIWDCIVKSRMILVLSFVRHLSVALVSLPIRVTCSWPRLNLAPQTLRL